MDSNKVKYAAEVGILVIFVVFGLLSPVRATTYHYCYPGLTTGNNDGSCWANAWREFSNINWSTLQSEAASQPVYLYIKKGTTTSSSLTARGSGSSDSNRIIVTTDPTDAGPNPIISGATSSAINANGKSYLTFQKIEITANDVGVRGVQWDRSSNYLTFDSLVIHDFAGRAMEATSDGGDHWTISNCKIYNIIGSGSNTYWGLAAGGTNLTIIGNSIHHICEDAMSVNGTNVVIDGNEVYTVGYSSSYCANSHPDGLVLGNGSNWTIRNNYFHDLPSQCIWLENLYSPSNITIYNNVFANIAAGSGPIIIGGGGGGYLKIYNNTFYSNKNGAGTIQGEYNTVEIKNNLIFNQFSFTLTSTNWSSWTMDYNSLYSTTSPLAGMSLDGKGYSTLSTWRAATGQDAHSVWGVDPGFANAAGGDYHLTESTALTIRDAGTSLSSIFSTDKDGVVRPQGTGWDIGAYEYVEFGAPSAPKGLRVLP